ncbi:hypothetical protein C8J56DRAFT_874906 [Mycena floridula]|nr:hypothetical protein C8J56DRAFT_874906 [Mycena floridula]
MASESAGGPSSPQRLNSTTFSFKAPFPATTKQRRVSLALPSSPRLVPAWDFRDDTGLGSHVPECLMPEKRGKMRKIAPEGDDEKRPRKKWSEEETKMLVDGCQLHGVGNWKTILNDPNLRFDNRSPVDLKDRFRTYFPDAYKKHYPNAKTHLSSKVRSTLPDGSSLFEKARSKKRRPFTEEEDRALKAGYEKHGTLWATIAKDPVFQDQNRRSTDLRDRFRNAFPELYEAAGYKPRNKKMGGPVRSATDDTQVGMSSGPRRKRRNTSQGLLRGGTKSVPQSTAPSEDEDSSGEEDNPPSMSAPVQSPAIADDDEMDLGPMDPLSTSLSMADFDAHSQTWSSGLDTPTHSSIHAWSTNSPTSSHLSGEYLMNSPFQRRGDSLNGMIGKSAWGTNDWFSANPRLDNSGSSSLMDDNFSPSSPFSFHNLNHGVFDRYDLVPASMPHDFSSEVGIGETHSTFSDELFQPSGFRGFTHHSNYAGDLIFGARTQNPGGSSFGGFGLGLSQLGPGLPQSTGIHPMQLHTPALPGIDEIGLTGITLDDNAEIVPDPDVEVSLDDLVHSTPPGTPLTQPTIPSLRLRKRSVTFGNQFSVRSVSVPPTRPAQVQQTNSQPEIPTAARDSSRRPSDPTRRAGRPDSSRRPDPRSQPPTFILPESFPCNRSTPLPGSFVEFLNSVYIVQCSPSERLLRSSFPGFALLLQRPGAARASAGNKQNIDRSKLWISPEVPVSVVEHH